MSEQHTGAASNKPDWPRRKPTPEENVRRLQARIVKAREAGHYNKAKALEYLLAHSHAARVTAVERVTTNKGSKIAPLGGDPHRALNGALEVPEPCAGKLARTVLRGGGGGNTVALLYPMGGARYLAKMKVKLSAGL